MTGAAAAYLAGHPSAAPAQVREALVACATTGVISDPGAGSPDRLLNTRCGGPAITNPGAQFTAVGQAVTLKKITAPSAVRFAAADLPAGLSINASTGMISGTAATTGTTAVTLTVATEAGVTGSVSFTWQVGDGRILGVNGYCADSTNGSDANGNPIELGLMTGGRCPRFTVGQETRRIPGRSSRGAPRPEEGDYGHSPDGRSVGLQNWSLWPMRPSGKCLVMSAACASLKPVSGTATPRRGRLRLGAYADSGSRAGVAEHRQVLGDSRGGPAV